MSLKTLLRTILTLGRGVSAGLKDISADEDPITLFETWFQEAVDAGIYLPEAITLATCTADGMPSARMVLLKEFDASGFTFYTNYRSRKATELESNARAAIVAHWATLQRQVRIEGTVYKLSQEESQAYFASRARSSQLGAWASRQSAILENKNALHTRVEHFTRKFDSNDVPLPPFWGGFRVVPERIEYWQGRSSRLHDRLVFIRSSDGWTTHWLFP